MDDYKKEIVSEYTASDLDVKYVRWKRKSKRESKRLFSRMARKRLKTKLKKEL